MTIVSPYAPHWFASTPTTLAAGSVVQLAWDPPTDAIVDPGTSVPGYASPLIACYPPDALTSPVLVATVQPAAGDPIQVQLTYADGVVSFAVPSTSSYHGALVCQPNLAPRPQVTACTGFASCTATVLLPLPQSFSTSI